MAGRTRQLLSLLRWLGPWTPDARVPSDVDREHWVIREGALRGHRAFVAGSPRDADEPAVLDAYVYRGSRPPVGTYVIAPGLHFLGPDDPRFDRFCRVIATAGFVVVAPFLPSYVDLNVNPTVVDDFEQVLVAASDRFAELGRPTVFSISFGSYPALEVAARQKERVDAVVTFGGYAEFDETVRFCVTGRMRTPEGEAVVVPDALNPPALFINIVRFLDVGDDAEALCDAWRQMSYRTWGKMELKAEGRLVPFIDALAPLVPEARRALFRVGCGNSPGASALLEQALVVGKDALAFANPRFGLASLECPVVICHGRDDDVIPWVEAVKLHDALRSRVPTRLLLTGLYAHTGQGSVGAGGLLREAKTLLDIARTLADGGRLRETLTMPSSARRVDSDPVA